jgi:poly [ADP-ribose] polymerase
MSNVIRHQKFVSVDVGYAAKSENPHLLGSNKVWECLVHDNGDFEAIYGKVGGTMSHDVKPLGSVAAANAYADKKIKEKTKAKTDPKTGMVTQYDEVTTVETNGFQPAVKTARSDLSRIAKAQISHSNPIVADLIDRLAKANIHDILEWSKKTHSNLTYNDTTGLFSTPLGIVEQSVIDDARGILVEIGDFVVAGNYEDDAFIQALNKFMKKIPQDRGYGKLSTQTMFPDLSSVQQMNAVLDSLQASLQMALAPPTDGKPVVVDEPRVFEVDLQLVEDGKEIDRLRKLYRDTKLDMHVAAYLDLKRAFTVDIRTMREAFEPVAAKLGNLVEAWHGSRTANLLSILRQGLIVPPANAPHCTGRLYGPGAYGALHSTKSLNYSLGGVWDNGKRDENCYMFRMDMAMGRVFHPTAREAGPYPKPGYDSIWAKGGVSPGVRNDELIVPKVSQCNLKYLLEFTPGGK